MDNIVTINKEVASTLEFKLEMEGLDSSEGLKVRLCVYTPKFNYMFDCEHAGSDLYVAKIPPMSFLEKSMYNCIIEVMAEGYYFEAMHGQVNVVGNHHIQAQPVYKGPKDKRPEEVEPKDVVQQVVPKSEVKDEDEETAAYESKPAKKFSLMSKEEAEIEKTVKEAMETVIDKPVKKKTKKKAAKKKLIEAEEVKEPTNDDKIHAILGTADKKKLGLKKSGVVKL